MNVMSFEVLKADCMRKMGHFLPCDTLLFVRFEAVLVPAQHYESTLSHECKDLYRLNFSINWK